MKATIKFTSDEINNIIRQHLYRLKGIQKITTFTPLIQNSYHGEVQTFDGIEVNVELEDSLL